MQSKDKGFPKDELKADHKHDDIFRIYSPNELIKLPLNITRDIRVKKESCLKFSNEGLKRQ